MANTALIPGEQCGARWWFVPAGAVAALPAIGDLQIADGRGDVVLTRNEVMQEALGGRTWRGALNNVADRVYADVAVHIRFHDRDGQPVGSPVSGRAARLCPGVPLHMQARLPAEATGLKIHALRWTRGVRTVELGPGASLAFGAKAN